MRQKRENKRDAKQLNKDIDLWGIWEIYKFKIRNQHLIGGVIDETDEDTYKNNNNINNNNDIEYEKNTSEEENKKENNKKLKNQNTFFKLNKE